MPGATAWIRPTPPVPCETAAKRSLGRSAASTVGSNGRPVWEVLIGLRVGIDQGNQHHGVCPVFQWCRLPCAIARCDPVPGSRSGAGSCDHRRLGTGQELSVAALPAEGFQLYPVNLQAADRYRAPFSPAGRKDDNRDAMVLAEIQRTSRHHLQPLHRKSETLRHSGQSQAITIPWWRSARGRPISSPPICTPITRGPWNYSPTWAPFCVLSGPRPASPGAARKAMDREASPPHR